MSTTQKQAWKPASEPPPLKREPDNWRAESEPVLGFYTWKKQAVVIAWQDYDLDTGETEGPVKWSTCDSESWDISGEVTHWQPLPAPPEE